MMHKKLPFKKIIGVGLLGIVTLVVTVLFLTSPMQEVNTQTPLPPERILYVGGTRHDNYAKISDAINDAKEGDIIFVYSKSAPYYENIVVDKSIRLIGENKGTTIIDGGGDGDVVQITANKVSFSNFTICNGGTGQEHLNDACIEITSDNNIISDNICLSTNYGIWLRNSTGNIIRDNKCTAKYDGIWLLNSGDNLLQNNSVIDCGLVLDGLSLSSFIQDIDTSNVANGKPIYYYKNQNSINVPSDAGQVILVNCEQCIISNLEMYNVTDGIQILHSQRNTIENNRLTGNTDFGIRLVKSDYNIIINNICSNNPVGIGFKSGGDWLEDIDADCEYNTITENSISNNYYCGILLDSSDHNTISKNNFEENGKSAFFLDSYRNRWHRNYWDDWIGAKRKIFIFSPKVISGMKNIQLLKERTIPWGNVDWRPARSPYNF